MAINWTPRTDGPQGAPVQTQLASVGDMLQAFAERKQRLAMEEARRQQEQQFHADLLAEQQRDNEREQMRLKTEDARVREMAQQRQDFDAEQHRLNREATSNTRAAEAVPKVQQAFEAGGAPMAKPVALAGGLGWDPVWNPPAPTPTGKGPGEDLMEPSPDPTRFKISLPTGGVFDLEEGAAEGAKKREGARLLGALNEQFAPVAKTDKYIAKALADVGPVLQSGKYTEKDAAPNAILARAKELKAADDAMERARMAGARASAVKPGAAIDDDRQDGAEARQVLSGIQARSDYTKKLEALEASKAMLEDLSSGNQASQRGALGAWAKAKSGPGAVQQSERDQFVNVVGGKGEQYKKAAMEWLDGGKIPDDQIAIFAEALRTVEISRNQKLLGRIKNTVKNAFEHHPNARLRDPRYADWAMSQIDTGEEAAPARSDLETELARREAKYAK